MPKRCFGDGPGHELYAIYHDEEWGIPEHDDRKLFEMLILEGVQAGLNWELVLKKRKAYRRAYHFFEPAKVAAMSDTDLEELIKNPELIRNRLKIFTARQNARVFLAIQEEWGSFDRYLWAYVEGRPIQNHWSSIDQIPSSTSTSEVLSKDLKKRGMRFVGPTIIYAYMQAVGLVNDHLVSCPCYSLSSD